MRPLSLTTPLCLCVLLTTCTDPLPPGLDGPACGNGTCESSEDCSSCAQDCGVCETFCGDGTCDDGIEACESCSEDCGACGSGCGDGSCDPLHESCESCASDCGSCAAVCGDASCDAAASETCQSCADDCGACGATCGDGTCDAALEDCESCGADCGACGPYCGDGTCDRGVETCTSCQKDCGECATPPAEPPELKLVSFNVFFGNSAANLGEALKGFQSEGVDVIGFQEMSDNGKPDALANKTGCATCFYDAWIPGSPGEGGNVSIIWKKSRFSVTRTPDGTPMRYAFKVHGSEPVEDGAGGTTTTPKYIVYVSLKDNVSGQTFWFMNAHGLASVEGSCGHPANKPRRLALYKKMMDSFKELIRTKDRPLFITGDYNVNYRCDKDVHHYRFPWASFNSLNPKVKSNWEWHERAGKALPSIGTHKPHQGGRRIIDYVFGKAHPDVSYKSTAIWSERRFGSDHAPVLAVYVLRKN